MLFFIMRARMQEIPKLGDAEYLTHWDGDVPDLLIICSCPTCVTIPNLLALDQTLWVWIWVPKLGTLGPDLLGWGRNWPLEIWFSPYVLPCHVLPCQIWSC